MKKLDFIKAFLAAFFVAAGAWAQDVIYMRNGSEIKARVLRNYTVMGTVEFVLSSNGQSSSVPVAQVERIQYADGHRVSYVCGGCLNVGQSANISASGGSSQAQNSFTQEQNNASSGQKTIKPQTGAGDKDYEKRQKSIVKFTSDLEKTEKTLTEIKFIAPATYEVTKFSIDFLKMVNRVQEKRSFVFDEVLPFILRATFMTLPPNTISPSARIDTDISAKLFPFLTVDFKLQPNKTIDIINSALEDWNGKSIYDIKNEMTTA